jgi:hypothetical protein
MSFVAIRSMYKTFPLVVITMHSHASCIPDCSLAQVSRAASCLLPKKKDHVQENAKVIMLDREKLSFQTYPILVSEKRILTRIRSVLLRRSCVGCGCDGSWSGVGCASCVRDASGEPHALRRHGRGRCGDGGGRGGRGEW